MTVAYDVSVPRGTIVTTKSDSGATTVSGVAGDVSVRTQSAAIAIRDLGGNADVATGSGAVQIDGIAGDLKVAAEASSPRRTAAGSGSAGFPPLHGR